MERRSSKLKSEPIKVLIVDDSPLVRNILTLGLGMDKDIKVVGSAADPYKARDMIVQLNPDVLTLDVEMPKMNGVEFLKKLMPQYPLPVIMVSALTGKGKKITLDALEAGAIDFVTKPSSNLSQGLNEMLAELKLKIKVASNANLSHWRNGQVHGENNNKIIRKRLSRLTKNVIVIGASTGGTQAIKEILTKLPADSPGILIVQHMPAGFTKIFSDRMNEVCPMEVKEAKSGDLVVPGVVLIAPGSKHMTVMKSGSTYQVICQEGDKVNGHCPSVDVLMHSVANVIGPDAIGIMLTGMGKDGASGMFAMHEKGSINIAQNEESCIVYGMPKEAYKKGGVDHLLHLNNIAASVLNLLEIKA